MRISDWSSDVCSSDLLTCTRCDWTYAGWIGSKSKLRDHPPAIFLPTTDSLHQWLHDVRYGRLFGDDPGFAAPRAVLADEIHLYSHVHGAQVGYTLRRLAARAETNGDGATPMLAIGMSATLGDPAEARSEEHTSELQSLMRISYDVFCLKKKKQ